MYFFFSLHVQFSASVNYPLTDSAQTSLQGLRFCLFQTVILANPFQPSRWTHSRYFYSLHQHPVYCWRRMPGPSHTNTLYTADGAFPVLLTPTPCILLTAHALSFSHQHPVYCWRRMFHSLRRTPSKGMSSKR